MKIFNMDDCTWVAAENLDDAWRAFAEFYGYDLTPEGIEEARTDNQGIEPEELSDEALDRYRFFDDMDDPESSDSRTFREQLALMQQRGDTFPCFFATTEY